MATSLSLPPFQVARYTELKVPEWRQMQSKVLLASLVTFGNFILASSMDKGIETLVLVLEIKGGT